MLLSRHISQQVTVSERSGGDSGEKRLVSSGHASQPTSAQFSTKIPRAPAPPKERAPTQEKASISRPLFQIQGHDFVHEPSCDRSSPTKFPNDFSDGYGTMSDDDDYENGPPSYSTGPTLRAARNTIADCCQTGTLLRSHRYPHVSRKSRARHLAWSPRKHILCQQSQNPALVAVQPLLVPDNNRLGQQLPLTQHLEETMPCKSVHHDNASMRVRATEGNSRQRMQTPKTTLPPRSSSFGVRTLWIASIARE